MPLSSREWIYHFSSRHILQFTLEEMTDQITRMIEHRGIWSIEKNSATAIDPVIVVFTCQRSPGARILKGFFLVMYIARFLSDGGTEKNGRTKAEVIKLMNVVLDGYAFHELLKSHKDFLWYWRIDRIENRAATVAVDRHSLHSLSFLAGNY